MNQANNDIRLLVVVGIAAMLLLFISILLIFIFTQRKKIQYQQSLHALQQSQQFQMIEAAVRSEETERHRIAEELHSEVGALLSSAKLHFRMLKLDGEIKDNKGLYEKGNELLDDCINKIRDISHSLHSHILQEFGLNEAIKHFADKIAHGSVIKTATALDPTYTTTLLPQKDISIYRIIQELLNNTIKHAQPNEINISSTYEKDSLFIIIKHNGVGLTQPIFEKLRFTSSGLGLKNIQTRVNLLKGNINFSRSSDHYYIQIYIPKT
ncbi:sensor histidine kinase [Mucilaginibacter agri]|uniref:histidine kinase n=1 Tax=Mucilaginibacter agri TaxID=2695265 RepID=A0A965ZJJ0_9SPHI|nr:ATP-binding protein [Mucilaginibacter agri]NCD72300.1 GHKL domain-containing protein [Mucilaginibacter agri]